MCYHFKREWNGLYEQVGVYWGPVELTWLKRRCAYVGVCGFLPELISECVVWKGQREKIKLSCSAAAVAARLHANTMKSSHTYIMCSVCERVCVVHRRDLNNCSKPFIDKKHEIKEGCWISGGFTIIAQIHSVFPTTWELCYDWTVWRAGLWCVSVLCVSEVLGEAGRDVCAGRSRHLQPTGCNQHLLLYLDLDPMISAMTESQNWPIKTESIFWPLSTEPSSYRTTCTCQINCCFAQ